MKEVTPSPDLKMLKLRTEMDNLNKLNKVSELNGLSELN